MASKGSGNRGPKKPPTPEELANELARLRMENKQLRSKLQGHNTEDTVLTPTMKEAMITSATSNLTRQAATQIEEKVRKATAKVTLKSEMEDTLKLLSFKVSVSMTDMGGRSSESSQPKSRSRSKSKSRRPQEQS
nr:homolog of EHV2 ORF52 virion protein G52 [Macronycteris gammaherpesvirus 1]